MLLRKSNAALSGLLARKGEASPAIRRQRVAIQAAGAAPIVVRRPADRDGDAILGEAARHAVRLRLDENRYLKLRLAAAATGRSTHEIVAAALDTFLATFPEDDCADRAVAPSPHTIVRGPKS